jgi:hypothetical protein
VVFAVISVIAFRCRCIAASNSLWMVIRMRTALILFTTPVLSGYVTARPLTLPSGAQGEVIRCNGISPSMADCYWTAREVCPKGYDIVDSHGEAHPLILANNSSMIRGSVLQRSLLVQRHS